MYQYDDPTCATALPAPAAAGTAGYFTDGNPSGGVAATDLRSDFMNMLMLELLNVVTAAGVTPSKTTYTQVVQAIGRLIQTTTVLADTGAANAYSAVNAVPLTAATWVDGIVQAVKIAHTNTTSSSYAPDGLPAIPIYGLGLSALQKGELFAGGIAILMRATIAGVNSGNPICVLMECAGGPQQVPTATQSNHALQLGQAQAIPSSIQSIAAAVASNALTLTWQPQPLIFRNASLANGAPVTAPAPATALSIVVPSGATLGTVAGQQATLVLLVAYNAGSPVLCVANIAGGLDFSETGVVSPTTISAGATSAGVVYSAAAVAAGSPYRVVGYVQVTEATAGTWATAPSTAQGSGGQALTSMQSLGYGQAWQDFTASRAIGTTYYNTTARPIVVAVRVTTSATAAAVLSINGVTADSGAGVSGATPAATGIVPPGGSYSAALSSGSLLSWSELR